MSRCYIQVAIALLFWSCPAGMTIADEAATRPNFVIFYVDDLGWADTSVRMMDDEPLSASDFYQTPALEQLAKRGMRFSSGYAQIRARHLDKVDGGGVSEVYAAYFEWLDESFRKKEQRFQRDLESLKQKNAPDFEEQRARLEADLQAEKLERAAKTAICKDQMTNPSWRESTKKEVVKRLGVDKQANPIKTRQ